MKRQILDAARDICLEHGIKALTMRRLGERLGVTATALYRHYDNKEELIQHLVDEANEVLGSYLFQSLKANTPWKRIHRVALEYLRFAMEKPQYYEILFFSKGRKDMNLLPEEQKSKNFIFLLDRIRECQSEGTMVEDSPTTLGITIWGLMHGIIALYRQGRFGKNVNKFRSTYHAALLHLLNGLASIHKRAGLRRPF